MISLNMLKVLIEGLDEENDLNFDTFFENLMEITDVLDQDVEPISEFLQNDLGVTSDVEVMDMDDGELEQLSDMINKLMT